MNRRLSEWDPWTLWSTASENEQRLGLVGKTVDPIRAPKGGRVEVSADGKWLTVYGPPPADDFRPVAIEVYHRTRAFAPPMRRGRRGRR